MLTYTNETHSIRETQLTGFFVGWPNPPSPATHLQLLNSSYRAWLAIDGDTQQVVGFIYAISDGLLAAFIPLLEVLPEYHGRGIGTELTKRLLTDLAHLYSIDLLCDEALIPFYERLGMTATQGMLIRHYANQSGSSDKTP